MVEPIDIHGRISNHVSDCPSPDCPGPACPGPDCRGKQRDRQPVQLKIWTLPVAAPVRPDLVSCTMQGLLESQIVPEQMWLGNINPSMKSRETMLGIPQMNGLPPIRKFYFKVSVPPHKSRLL